MAVSSPGEAMRRLRLEHGLEIAAVAAKTGLEASRIEDLEADASVAWFQEALLLASAYGMAIDDFAQEVLGSLAADESPSAEVRTRDVKDLS